MDRMTVRRLDEGLWRWTCPHPQWRAGGGWDRAVGSVYCETPGAVALVDPLVPEEPGDRDRFWRALDRDVERLDLPVAVLLTCRWHVRSAAAVRARYGADVWAPTLAGPGLEGVATRAVTDGEAPVPGVLAFSTGMPNPEEEAVYLLEEHGAVVPGDVLLGDGAGGVRLAPGSWYSDSEEERAWYRTGLREALRRLLAHAPRMVLVAHGDPVVEDAARALTRALAADGGD